MKETLLDDIDNGQSNIYAQNRTYIPQTDEYLFIDYIYGFPGYKYYILLDAKTGEQNCLRIVDNSYSVGGLTTNIHTGDIMFHFNGLYGFVNPCLGSTTRLSQIPDYHSALNNQMVMYDHSKDTYIIPYVSKNPNDQYKIAIIDVYSDIIMSAFSQPWEGEMNLQQIYDKPTPPIISREDTLFVPYGYEYRWFNNGEYLCETNENWWIPAKSGTYSAQVKFKTYTTTTNPIELVIQDEEEPFIQVFPNPTLRVAHVRFQQVDHFEVSVYNMAGQFIVTEYGCGDNNVTVNLQGLPPGAYILFINAGMNIYTRRLVKM
jgi:hypothetical protein